MPDGSFAPGFSPADQYYMNSHAGQRMVFSGYWGRPVFESELPDYERAAYGLGPVGGGQPGPGGESYFDNGMGMWYTPGAGYSKNKPSSGGQPVGSSGGMSGGNGYWSRSEGGWGNDQTAYQRAATNAIQQMYNRIRGRSQTAVNTDLARRGIGSSGVGAGIMADKMHEMDLNETADIAKIWQQGPGGSSSGAFGSGQTNAGYSGGSGISNFWGLPGFSSMPGSGPGASKNDGSRPGATFTAGGYSYNY